MRGVTKRFGTVLANDNVDSTLHPGEVLGPLGENGAGKTTLMNVLFGVYSADGGSIHIDGEPARIRNSADALANGVGMVHQHFHLVPVHTVLENLMVGLQKRGWRLQRDGARGQMEEIERLYGLKLDPDALVGALTIGEQQRVEIVKALIRGARVLILDEPTAALTPGEAKGLFDALKAMAGRGMGVIFISHKLHEVRAIADNVVILRQGAVTARVKNDAAVSKKRLAELMCGREITPLVKPAVKTGRVLLELKEIRAADGKRSRLEEINLNVRAGEIVGVAGVSGNGQSELADVIAGVLTPEGGSVEIDGRGVRRFNPREVQKLGVGRIPEDRMGAGLMITLPLSKSIVLPRIHDKRFSRFGFLNPRAVREFAEERIARYDIKTPGPDVRTGTLSGGNLQKALLARELAWDPLVLLAAQPTRGLDVSAARFVHERFLKLRSDQRAVIVISEDLEELFALSDRIAVMFEGRIMDILPIEEASVQKIGLLMAGVKEDAA
ncbi:MAG: ABC transporter ATP-binding protein [Desulfobacterales bacterium]|nr:ABC transporter ATP-binding protein [Desulfobacterales bacterium]